MQRQALTGSVARGLPAATPGVLAALFLTLLSAKPLPAHAQSHGDDNGDWAVTRARLIATGIPGAGAVAEVGDFLAGSPLHDKAAFVPFTQPGAVLAAKRVLVASSSNFGAPLARTGDPEGSILSIAPSAGVLEVPAGFAAAGGQASALGGAVQVYAAQNSAFLNAVQEPQALTAALPAVSLPLGISINNGNGRPWIANAPNGAAGFGTITVLDPQGYPLAGAPDPIAGGVFAGNLTNRNPADTQGLNAAAIGTAIITKSPDLTGRAVFAAVEADGSVVQVNVLKGVDLLAPAGTVVPLMAVSRDLAESNQPRVAVRSGLAFNWVPTRNLFIADPGANRLVVLDLQDNGTLFSATRREIRSHVFDVPIDIAPTAREVSSGSFASNTTLGGGSDLYVLNRGNNSIVRLGIDGAIRGGRVIDAGIAGFRANGIAVSSDGQLIYVTGTTPGHGGVLLVVPAFGGAPASNDLLQQARNVGLAGSMSDFASFLFSANISPTDGLGPLFNGQSCDACHSTPFAGGMGVAPGQAEHLVGRYDENGRFSNLAGHGGPVARARSISDLGLSCDAPTGIPADASIVSLRNSMTLRGNGLIDTIATGDMLANMAIEPAAVRGRPNVLPDGRVGKFGWKADVPTLIEFMGNAFRNELGVTNPIQPRDELKACHANEASPEVDAITLQAAAKFLNSISPPAPTAACLASPGAAIFQSSGCADCHTPVLPGPGARQPVRLYSDLLLHSMGPALADQMTQGSASGNEWRTTPLWRVSERSKFLHDGRALTLIDAILAHDGQAGTARNSFIALDAPTRQALLDFLGCL